MDDISRDLFGDLQHEWFLFTHFQLQSNNEDLDSRRNID